MSSRSWSSDEKLRVAGAVGGLLVVAAGVGLGLYAFRPDLLPAWVTDWLSSRLSSGQMKRVAIRLAVLAGLIVVAAVVVGMFRRRRLAFAEELIGELPASYEPAKHCHPSRYRDGIPQRVHLVLPPGFAVNGSEARTKLTKAMADRMGGQVKVRWHAGSFLSRPSGTFSRTARTAIAEAHEQGQDRVLELAADAMGVKGDYRITNVKEWGGATGAEPITFKLHYPRSVKFNDPVNQRRTEDALGTNLGVRLRGDWDLTREEVFLKKRPPMPGADGEPVLHPGVALIKKTAPHLIPVGVNENSETVYWDTKKDPHGLGVGPTNSGKTVTVRSVIAAALIKKWEVYICDPKRVEFSGFRHNWGVKSIAVEDKDMADLIVRIREQIMDVRYAEGEAKLNRGEDPEWDKYPPILVVLDEFTELVLAVGDLNKAKGMSGTPKAVDAVGRLGRLARLCNIHLIVLAQRPDAEKQFPGGARDQLTFRYSMTGLSPQSALMQWNNSDWGRFLPAIKGRGMCGVYGTEPEEVQFFWTPDPLFPKGEKDTQLRDQLRAECQKVQANVPASIDGADYDLGPLAPSPEGTLDDLVPDFDRVELIALPGEVTAETIKVPAETLTRGDRIIRDNAVFQVDRVEGDDDPVKIVIRSIRPADRKPQTITCRATESLNRLESVPGVDLPTIEEGTDVAAASADRATAAVTEPSPHSGATTPTPRNSGDGAGGSDSAQAWFAAKAALGQPSSDQLPTIDQPPVDQDQDVDQGGRAGEAEEPATGKLTHDGRLRVSELEPGQQIIRKNRKGQRVTYTVASADLVSGQVKLTLKPARGQNRVEALSPDTLVERGDPSVTG